MSKARRTNLFFLGMLVFYLCVCFFLIPVLPERIMNSNASIIFGQAVIAIPGIIFIIGTKGEVLKEMEFRRIGFVNTLLLVVLTYCMLPVISLVNAISMMFAKNYVSEQLDSMSSNSFLLNIFLVAVLPAFIEEFTFRGIIYNGFKQSTIKRAMLASALMFGLFHMNINQFCYAFLMGIAFTILREATGSMHSSMLVHFIFNANSVVMMKMLDMYRNYVNKMAQVNESFKEIADEMNNTVTESVSFAELSTMEILATIVPLLIFAVIGGVLGYFIIKCIAANCGRSYHIKQIMCSFVNKRAQVGFYDKEQHVETATGKFGGRIVDFVFITGVIVCVIMMI